MESLALKKESFISSLESLESVALNKESFISSLESLESLALNKESFISSQNLWKRHNPSCGKVSFQSQYCRFAVDFSKMTLIPLDSSVNTLNIGSRSSLSANDIITVNKAYSCAATKATNGGGYQQVGLVA